MNHLGILTTSDLVKEVLFLFALNVILPGFDVFSDLALIINLFVHGHPIWAGCLATPFVANYTITWFLWHKLENENKKLTWIAAFLSCYPQYVAGTILVLLFRKPQQALKKKKMMEREVSEIEVYAEAAPSALVLTMLWSFSRFSDSTDFQLISGEEGLFGINWFWVSYCTSFLTASLGMAKTLKTGPCRILKAGGLLGGLCTVRFLILMTSISASMIGKGIWLGFIAGAAADRVG